LITNNISLFLDDDIHTAHRPAVTNFWSRIRPFFHKNLLRSIEVAVIVTGCIHQEEKAKTSKDDSICCNKQLYDNTQYSDLTIESSTQALQRVKALETCFTELMDADIRTYGTGYQAISSVSFSINVLENFPTASYELGWRWLSQILSPPDFSRASIKFDLPETRDGSQCSISLDLQYHVFPYPADSEVAAGLLADMQYLTSCSIRVIQLVPISCIDANLLFGVPMKASPSFQDDEDQYKEMKALVLAFFQQLRERDVALMLVAIESTGLPEEKRIPLHQTAQQIYLLMSQSSGEASVNDGSLDASLFRYANADQMMPKRCTDTNSHCLLDVDAFRDYVDKALDEIPSGLVNPFLNHELHHTHDAVEKKQDADKTLCTSLRSHNLDVWTDASGVGSLVQSEEFGKTDEMSGIGVSYNYAEKNVNHGVSLDENDKRYDDGSSVHIPFKVIMNAEGDECVEKSYGTVHKHDSKLDIVQDSKDYTITMAEIEEKIQSSSIDVKNMIKVPTSISDLNPLSDSFVISRESPNRASDSVDLICVTVQNEILSREKTISKEVKLQGISAAIKSSTLRPTNELDLDACNDVAVCNLFYLQGKDSEARNSDNQHVIIDNGILDTKLNKEMYDDADNESDGHDSFEVEQDVSMITLSHTMTKAQRTAFGRSLSSDNSETENLFSTIDIQHGTHTSRNKVKTNDTNETSLSSDEDIFPSNTKKSHIAFLTSLIHSESDED
jgi:hypothetical protein